MLIQNNKITFKKPNLGIRKKFKLYVQLWERFAAIWNEYALKWNTENPGKKKLQPLKSQHEQFFYTLIRYFNIQLDKSNRELPDSSCTIETLPDLSINNVKLAKAIHKSQKTVWSYLNKFQEIGILTKIFHGTTANYDLKFNPEFIFLFDHENPEICHSSRFSNPLTVGDKITFCKPLRNTTRSINNKITDVDNSCNENLPPEEVTIKGVLSTSDKNPYKSPPNIELVVEIPIEIPGLMVENEKSRIQKIRENLKKQENQQTKKSFAERNKEHREFNARVLYGYALNMLWPGGFLWVDNGKKRYIRKPEQNKAIEHIAEHYFNHKTPKEMDQWLDAYQHGVRKSLSIINNKKIKGEMTYWFVNPSKYFNIHYEKGMQGALKYVYDHVKKSRENERQKRHEAIYRRSINIYLDNKSHANTVEIIKYIDKHLPRPYLEKFAAYLGEDALNNYKAKEIADLLPRDFQKLVINEKTA